MISKLFFRIRLIPVFGLLLIAFTACSVKEDKWLNRNFHAMNAYYNTIYHGNMALENGQRQIEEQYQNNFWEVLPIEPLFYDREEVELGGMLEDSLNFEEESKIRSTAGEESSPRTLERETESSRNAQPERIRRSFDQQGGMQSGERFPGENNPTATATDLNSTREFSPQTSASQDVFSQRNPSQTTNERQTGLSGREYDENRADLFAREARNMEMNESFQLAEEKAIKAIQKHSMIIKGVERNPLTKEAFLLLGQSRYYTQRFFPALEAFNYILNRYEDNQFLVTADIWREKVYLRLGNNDERVIDHLNYLLNNSEYVDDISVKDTSIAPFVLNKENLVATSSTLAQAYLNINEREKAIEALGLAVENTNDSYLRGRYLFIIGQLYEESEDFDGAELTFSHMVELNRKIPREFWIHALLKKLAYEKDREEDSNSVVKQYERLLKDWEMKPYLAVINFHTAEFYRDLDSMDTALNYYNRSLKNNTADYELKRQTYNTIADYYFDHKAYETAGSYYDSTLVNLPLVSREYRDLFKRRQNLSKVTHFEKVARENDSVLGLVDMSPVERQIHFQNYVDSLKNKALLKTQNLDKRKKTKGKSARKDVVSAQGRGGFYFYDQRQVEQGARIFKQIWGERSLQDNWRIERGRMAASDTQEEEQQEENAEALTDEIADDPKYKVENYLKEIPESEEIIEDLKEERNFAYYQLGLIYMEKLQELELAAECFEKLISKEKSDESLLIPSQYHLVKIYTQLNRSTEAAKYKSAILATYPDSRYAKILNNPEAYRKDETNPVKVYADLYRQYKSGNYEGLEEDLERSILFFNEDELVSKFELLRAQLEGRLKGLEAYETALKQVARTYAQSEEGKAAQKILTDGLPGLEKRSFKDQRWDKQKIVYRFIAADMPAARLLKDNLEGYLRENFDELHTTVDFYTQREIFVVVHGLRSEVGAAEFKDLMHKEVDFNLNYDSFVISSWNYETLLIHKNIEDYLYWHKLNKE